MKANRSTLPYLIAAAGGALLILSLFLAWVSVGGATASAWDIFSIVDLVLLLLALAAIAIGGARATGTELPVTALRPQLLKWIGTIALTIVVVYLLEDDHLGIGVFLALVGSAAMLAAAVLTERPDLTTRLADATGMPDDTRPAAAPPRGGSSTSTAAPAGASAGDVPAAGPGGGAGPGAGPGSHAGGGLGSGGSGAPTGAVPGAPGTGGAGAGGAGAASVSGPPQSSGPPAGWYPDPQGQARLRYWDGGAWTDQTSA